ncbi:linoleate diol synthase [Mycena amicta]|nr:linoleate diol synthase [Mycena amicta]
MNRRSSFFFRRQPSASGDAHANGSANGQAVTDSPSNPAAASKILQDLREQLVKGGTVLHTSALPALVDAIRHRDQIDDRMLALEHGINFVSKVPEGTKLATTLQNKIVELFYNDLSHPHATNIGNEYAWRSADGSRNNVTVPDMGRAGTPYARSVQQSHPLPKHELPDPSLLFDALLKRDGFVEHPAGLSSLMFSFAALVIHSVFRTSHSDVNINDTSSYVRRSLSVDCSIKTFFAEDRLLLLPPAVCVLLVLFNRNHNYIAKRMYEINERGKYQDPTTLTDENRSAQDEELFQTARLVNCGWFGSVIFSDYFAAILGLVREGSTWSMNPFGEIRSEDHAIFGRGQGNEDEKWVGQVFDKIFDGKSPDQVTPKDFKAAAYKIAQTRPDVTHWTFGNIARQSDGSFKDEDLANILKNATEHPAAAFRARGTPASMRLHEIMGIEQNRLWGVCSLNDFRRYLGLKPYANFTEWNPDPEIANVAEKLYGDIEYLELYVGLQAECPKPLVEGAGLCPGYTISRAILADAIALTRGDRHFTYDLTPYNLTSWGFADCQRDPHGLGFGSTLGRLFQRTLPNSFTENSTYAFFPLLTPPTMKANLAKLHLLEEYDVVRPKDERPVQLVQDYATVVDILKSAKFTSPYATRAAKIIKGKGFFIVESEEKRKDVYTKLFGSPDLLNKAGAFFRDTTRQLIALSSFKLVGGKTCVVDIVRDVLKLVPVYWSADIAGIELKTKENPGGDLTPIELYTMLSSIYEFVFLDTPKAKVKVFEAQVQGHVDKLLHHLNNGSRVSMVGSVATLFKNKKTEQQDIVKRLRDLGRPGSTELANMILAIMVAATAEMSLSLTNVLNVHLGSENEQKISSSGDINGYIREALRLDPPFRGVYRVASTEVTVGNTTFAKDTRVFLDVATVCVNAESTYPNPNAIDPSRKAESYLYADGCFKNLGEAFNLKVLAEVLKVVLSYKNIARAPGQSGNLKRPVSFTDGSRLDLRFAYLDSKSAVSTPWLGSMAIQYDTA